MTRKNWMLVGVAVVLAAVYVIYFTDWFRPKSLMIFHTSRVTPGRGGQGASAPNLMFGFSRDYQLTDIRVFPLQELRTNRNVIPVWHLVSDSNSVPTKLFGYGQNIRGMRPAFKGDRAKPLDTNMAYRLVVTALGISGEHDFMPVGQLPKSP